MPWQADVHDLVLVDASVTRAHTVDGWSVAEGVRARSGCERARAISEKPNFQLARIEQKVCSP